MVGEGEIQTEGYGDVENTIFVAVGKDLKDGKSLLLWTLQSFPGKNICLLHVYQPRHLLPLSDGRLSVSNVKQQAVEKLWEIQRRKVHKLMNQYSLILSNVEVHIGKVWIEMDSVEAGIVRIIAQLCIRWLVMGAASEKHYSKNMSELKSRKATLVCQKAPLSCQIWFTCRGFLVWKRSDEIGSDVERLEALSFPTGTRGEALLHNRTADVDGDAKTVQHVKLPASLTDIVVDTLSSYPMMMDEMRQDVLPSTSPDTSPELLCYSMSHLMMEEKHEGRETHELHEKLEHAINDTEKFKQKAFEESLRRWRAEEDAMEAMRKAEGSENLSMKEIIQRKEMEVLLTRQRQELERMKNQHEQLVKELHMVEDKRPELERQIRESQSVEKELEEKIIQAVKLLIMFKEQKDELQKEHDNTIKEISRLKKLVREDAMSLHSCQFKFSFLEIIDATQNFDPSLKIGDGRSGCTYKGLLRHVKVAIKMMPSWGSQGDMEFEHEVGVLSRVRHPNIVTLVGTCPEFNSLVYEYLENGSLEDCLACRGRTTPLSWQTRIKIAIEICSALIFLHFNRPIIIHGNLKPTKVLLDANFVSKLGELGVFHLIPHDNHDINLTRSPTSCKNTDPEDFVYMDPEFMDTGVLTTESDVYSFGIILLRLLTQRPALGIVKDVKCALENGILHTVLDISAGDWPLEQVTQLAHLALKCCEAKRFDRPDLVAGVWNVIQPMKYLCTTTCKEFKDQRRVPSQFVCPIFQEIMKDPCIAADGFTYEADAIKGWLYSGHKTSPMTNLKLENCDLVPNYALYYAIQQWQQQS